MSVTPCINCARPGVDRYCAHCGQRIHRERFAVRPLLRQAADDALNLDSGLLHTAVELSRRPGRMAKDYVAGRTRPYTNPAKYLVVCAALTTLVTLYSGFVDAQIEVAIGRGAAAQADAVARMMEFLQRYFNLLMILGVPLLAAFSRILFRPAGYNYAEHLIFSVFVYAQQNLLFVVCLPLFFALGDSVLFGLVYLAVITGYYVWACRGFFELGLGPTILRGSVAFGLFNLTYVLGTGAAITVAMPARG